MTNEKTNIFIMKPNSSKIKIGEIYFTKTGTKSITIENTKNETVNNFNRKIIEFIKEDNNIEDNIPFFVFSDDMVGMIFHIMRWRRCTGYLVIQKSDNGTRYLAYLHDKIKHSSTSFGTTCNLVKFKDIKEGYQKELPKLKEEINKAEKILLLKESINNLSTKFDDNFGI